MNTSSLRPTAIVNRRVDGGFSVEVVWSGVDRPSTGGFGLSAQHGALAQRLARAIEAGVVYTQPSIVLDVNGASYVQANCRVLGRTMNADLKRLGF